VLWWRCGTAVAAVSKCLLIARAIARVRYAEEVTIEMGRSAFPLVLVAANVIIGLARQWQRCCLHLRGCSCVLQACNGDTAVPSRRLWLQRSMLMACFTVSAAKGGSAEQVLLMHPLIGGAPFTKSLAIRHPPRAAACVQTRASTATPSGRPGAAALPRRLPRPHTSSAAALLAPVAPSSLPQCQRPRHAPLPMRGWTARQLRTALALRRWGRSRARAP
jgi:hypothetical protein